MAREPRESELIPVPANETRSREMGGFVIREQYLLKMRKGIDAGLAFPDAADAAGIPYEFVVAALSYDDDMRSWFRECIGRKSLIRSEDAHLLPDTKSTLELKTESVNLAMSAGLGRRFAEAIANLRPVNPDGSFNKEHMNVMVAMGKQVFGMMPHETDNAHRTPRELKAPRSELTVAQELIEMREKRLRLEAEETRAIEARRTGGSSLKGPRPDDAPR